MVDYVSLSDLQVLRGNKSSVTKPHCGHVLFFFVYEHVLYRSISRAVG